MDRAERRVLSALIETALAANLSVSVFDGEEWAIREARDESLIIPECGMTDMDRLHFHAPDGTDMGWVLLIYGNGAEELVNDHSGSVVIDALVHAALAEGLRR